MNEEPTEKDFESKAATDEQPDGESIPQPAEPQHPVEDNDSGFVNPENTESIPQEEEIAVYPEDETPPLDTDDDGFIVPPTFEESPAVVVQDFDPADPGAPVAEPQKIMKPHDRIARKRARGSRE